MQKKVLILSSSPRIGSNSELLADRFAQGASESGHLVEKITLRDQQIHFCKGCLACVKSNRCVIEDDMAWILGKMKQADVLVFATPVYYYELCGQMKTLLDRSNPLYTDTYAFSDIYLIMTAAEDGDHVWKRVVNGLEGWIECYEKAHLSGVVFGGGVNGPKEIISHSAMQKAYEMGKAV